MGGGRIIFPSFVDILEVRVGRMLLGLRLLLLGENWERVSWMRAGMVGMQLTMMPVLISRTVNTSKGVKCQVRS